MKLEESSLYRSKRAVLDSYNLDDDGRIRLSFLVVGRIKTNDFIIEEDLTNEELAKARDLAKQMHQLENAYPQEVQYTSDQ
jgi:hypothetical protein